MKKDPPLADIDKRIQDELLNIGEDLSAHLGSIAGEKTGFLLLTFPVGRKGWHGFITNCPETEVVKKFLRDCADNLDNPEFQLHGGRLDS